MAKNHNSGIIRHLSPYLGTPRRYDGGEPSAIYTRRAILSDYVLAIGDGTSQQEAILPVG